MRPFEETTHRDREFQSYGTDLDGKIVRKVSSGKELDNLLPLITASNMLDGESYDGFLVEENPTTSFKIIHYFNQGEEQFNITLGTNSDGDMGALKGEPTQLITKLFFAQGLNTGNEPVGSIMGILFAVGGVNVTFSILLDSSGFFEVQNNFQIVSTVAIPEGAYSLVVKAEGNNTQYIDQIEIIVGATAIISNINLSSIVIQTDAAIGTSVGALSTTGGEPPIAYSISAQTLNGISVDVFEIVNNTLITKSAMAATGSTYSIFIRAEDSRAELPENERVKVEEFPIEVVANSFTNTNSLSFNGADEYLRIPAHPSMNVTTSFSVSAWVKGDAFPSGNTDYFTKWDNTASQRSIICRVNSGGFVQMLLSADGITAETVSSSEGILANTWYHLVCQFTANEARIYINGVEKTSNPNIGISTVKNNTPDVLIGARFSNSLPTSFMDGLIDEVCFYNDILTQAEITAIYNNGAPNDLSALSSASKIISWWRMGDFFSGNDVPDQVGVNNASPVNMNNSNKSTDIPT